MKELKKVMNGVKLLGTTIILAASILSILMAGCKKELTHSPIAVKGSTDAVIPYTFNWETIDWMPTPSGQSQIPPPWIGQGSISSIYDIDVLNDHKASDGWVLVYNTFDPNADGPLVNPYFMLYNKYRGLLRIYLYTTSQFITPSTYLQDGLTVVSSSSSSMLNFLGTDLVDVASNRSSFSQLEPAPKDGSLPLASNKWYMLQYELAYDPQIANMNYQNIQLSWYTNFYGVANISLGGKITGTANAITGASSAESNIFSALGNGGKVAGTAVLSGIGSQFITKHAWDGGDAPGSQTPGDNDLGLSNDIFSSISKGISGALSGATGNIPGAITNIFSAIFGGSSSGQTLSFNLNATMTLTGTSTSGGSFPSSPTSVWVPGSIISPSAQNFIPLYNQTMGVFNLSTRPQVPVIITSKTIYPGLPHGIGLKVSVLKISNVDNSNLILYNPAVTNAASVAVVKQDILLIKTSSTGNASITSYDGTLESVGIYKAVYVNPTTINVNGSIGFTKAVRYTIRITPFNGAPASTIVKTFLAN